MNNHNNDNKVLTTAGFDVDKMVKDTIRHLVYTASDSLHQAIHLCIMNYGLDNKEMEEIQETLSEHREAIWSIWEKLSEDVGE